MSERRAVVLAGAVVAIVLAVLAVRWATQERAVVAATPQPPPLERTGLVAVEPGERACLDRLTLVPEADALQFRVGTRGRPPVPLEVTLDSAAAQAERRIGPTWTDNDLLTVDVPSPSRPVEARVCIGNDGRRPIDLYAADDRTLSAMRTTVAGRPVDANVQLTFVGAPESVAGQAASIVRELSAFRPGFVGPWLLWPLAVLVVAGLPLALVWALRRAVGDDAR